MILPLYSPTTHYHGSSLSHCPCNSLDRICANLCNLFSPLRCLRHTISFAQQIWQELIKADRVLIQELLVIKVLFVKGVSNSKHHRHIRIWPYWNPFSIQILCRISHPRINRNNRFTPILELFNCIVGIMIGWIPTNLVVLQKVCTPKNNRIGVLKYRGPCCLPIINLNIPCYMWQNRHCSLNAEITGTIRKSTKEVQHPSQKRRCSVKFSNTVPVNASCKDSRIPILCLDPLHFLNYYVNCLIPAYPDEPISTPQGFVASVTMPKIALPNHGVFNPILSIYPISQALNHRYGIFINKRFHMCKLTTLYECLNRTPVGCRCSFVSL